jgi:hypothetical protein
MQKLLFIIALSFLTLLTTHAVANSDKSNLILGSWKDEDSRMEYFRDGTFISNADTGEKYTGTWSIEGNTLRLQFISPVRGLNVYTIMVMTDSAYKIKLNHADRRTANARRIEPVKQVPVYTTKNSRTYHKRNCSKLNTSDLVEFKSSNYADSAGAIPCKKCNQLAAVERKSSGGNTGVVEKIKRSSESILSQHMKEYGSETSSWMTDKKTGCKFWNPKLILNESISWSGECVDGKAHGTGILRWYINGIEVSTDTITAKNGVTMINGVMMADVKTSDVVFNLSPSDNGCVIGDVKKEIDLSNYYVVMDILKKSVLFRGKKNHKKISNYSIIVILNQGGKRVVHARSYEKHKLTLNEYSNDAYSKRLKKEEERKKNTFSCEGRKQRNKHKKLLNHLI